MLCHISSGWFKHIEPHRTTSKHMIADRARCVELCHISSGWFKHIEPHRTSSNHIELHQTFSKRILLERARCVEFCHHYKPRTCPPRWVQPQQTSSNILEPLQCRESKVCRDLLHEFGVVRLYRTISNHIVTRVYGTYTLVPGGSTAATFLEPS